MEGSGPRYNEITAFSSERPVRAVTTYVLVTKEHVEIGGWNFDREQLMLALGVNEGGDVRHQDC